MPARAASSTATTCRPHCSMARPSGPDRCAACPQPTSRRWSSDRFASISSRIAGNGRPQPRRALTSRASRSSHEQLVIELAQVRTAAIVRLAEADGTLRVPWQKTAIDAAPGDSRARRNHRHNTLVRYARKIAPHWLHPSPAVAVGSTSLSPIRQQARKALPSAKDAAFAKST